MLCHVVACTVQAPHVLLALSVSCISLLNDVLHFHTC